MARVVGGSAQTLDLVKRLENPCHLGAGLVEYVREMRNELEHRSEEHTSELQSLRHLVCRLLLDTATTEIYTLSLHDALPIYLVKRLENPCHLGAGLVEYVREMRNELEH